MTDITVIKAAMPIISPTIDAIEMKEMIVILALGAGVAQADKERKGLQVGRREV